MSYMLDYLLEENWLYWDGMDELPIIRAATNPDPRALIACLDKYEKMKQGIPQSPPARGFSPGLDWFDPSTFSYDGIPVSLPMKTPVTEAIRVQLPDNVRLPLKHGADPNGFPLRIMEQFAEKFLRFKENGEDPHWFSWDPKFRPKWIRPETLSEDDGPKSWGRRWKSVLYT